MFGKYIVVMRRDKEILIIIIINYGIMSLCGLPDS